MRLDIIAVKKPIQLKDSSAAEAAATPSMIGMRVATTGSGVGVPRMSCTAGGKRCRGEGLERQAASSAAATQDGARRQRSPAEQSSTAAATPQTRADACSYSDSNGNGNGNGDGDGNSSDGNRDGQQQQQQQQPARLRQHHVEGRLQGLDGVRQRDGDGGERQVGCHMADGVHRGGARQGGQLILGDGLHGGESRESSSQAGYHAFLTSRFCKQEGFRCGGRRGEEEQALCYLSPPPRCKPCCCGCGSTHCYLHLLLPPTLHPPLGCCCQRFAAAAAAAACCHSFAAATPCDPSPKPPPPLLTLSNDAFLAPIR